MKVKAALLFSISLLTGCALDALAIKSRNFTWIDPKTVSRNLINVDTKEWIVEEMPGLWTLKGSFVSLNDLSDLPQSFETRHFFDSQSQKIFFTVVGTGQVYVFDLSSRKLQRIDRTYYRGYNFNPVQFIRKNRIYSFGGYGFWTYSNALTYFDEKRAEWEIISPRNAGPDFIYGEGFNGYHPASDVFYAGGNKQDPHAPNKKPANEKLFFRYDFKINKWEELGELNDLLLSDDRKPEIFWNEQYFFKWAFDRLYIADPVSNKLYEYRNNEKVFVTDLMVFAKGDTIYNFWNDKVNIDRLSIKEVMSKAKHIGAFYHYPNQKWYLLGGFALVFPPALWLIYKRSRRRLAIGYFNASEKTLLRALLAKKLLAAQDVNDVLNLDAKSLDNQRRIRLNIINQINASFQKNFGIKEAIERHSSDEDKRMSIYILKSEAIKVLKEINLS